jgi:hypothetical protein
VLGSPHSIPFRYGPSSTANGVHVVVRGIGASPTVAPDVSPNVRVSVTSTLTVAAAECIMAFVFDSCRNNRCCEMDTTSSPKTGR